MKAIVFHGIGDIRLEDVPEPRLKEPTDAIVRITTSAICGTDLHMVRGTLSGMKKGTILGHEGVGVVEAIGKDVRNLSIGDRVIIPSTIACGYCSYCRAGYTSQCDTANPNGKKAGTAFFGGPKLTGPFEGLQAEKARIPFAGVNLVKIPDTVSDEQAILLSDIGPTGYFAADIAEIKPGDSVAVFGCGPVGQFAILGAKLKGAARVFAVDRIPARLETARRQGAEVIDFDAEDPVEAIGRLTGDIGVDRAIDAVGVDADHPDSGPAGKKAKSQAKEFEQEIAQVAPQAAKGDSDGSWKPGSAPSQVLQWAIASVCKAGTLSIVGVYPETMQSFPIGQAMNKNLTLKMGNCNHRKYIPYLLDLMVSRVIRPEEFLEQVQPMSSALEAYEAFNARRQGWLKVELEPSA